MFDLIPRQGVSEHAKILRKIGTDWSPTTPWARSEISKSALTELCRAGLIFARLDYGFRLADGGAFRWRLKLTGDRGVTGFLRKQMETAAAGRTVEQRSFGEIEEVCLTELGSSAKSASDWQRKVSRFVELRREQGWADGVVRIEREQQTSPQAASVNIAASQANAAANASVGDIHVTVVNEIQPPVVASQGTTVAEPAEEEPEGDRGPSDYEYWCYLLYGVAEAYLIEKHGSSRPRQSEVYGVLKTSYGNEIEAPGVPDNFKMPNTEDAFLKAYRRGKKSLSRARPDNSDK
ncbi:hypothetical protein CA51_11150 [Rosistilla oblonga]|uniref:hypothetical protein n=1 Tax=Rosistilla oblonga TaxID=2527990 RepID=UPI00118B3112|nr:hypothetical protein [Rosistilla oblonga]QDV11254.1 hypothetical protein CA51_11150 [Rosistilla oblonga]